MSVFTRLHRITIGSIESFLSRFEDPETVFPVLIKEMETQLELAAQSQAKAAAAVKHCQREVDKHAQTTAKYESGAFLAVEKEDEETARQAIEAQITAEKSAEFAERNLLSARQSLEKAELSRKKIQSQLKELVGKKDEILTRARLAKAQKKIQSTVNGFVGSSDSILDSVARLESKLEQQETELEIQSNLSGEGSGDMILERRLKELSNEAEITRRLNEIKKGITHEA